MKTLSQLRSDIQAIDSKIIELIALRQQLATKIGAYKKAHNMTILDAQRESELNHVHDLVSKSVGAPQEAIRRIFTILMNEARHIQEE